MAIRFDTGINLKRTFFSPETLKTSAPSSPKIVYPIIITSGLKENNIPVIGLDVDEETFGTRYEEEYTVSQMVGYITKKRKLKKRNFDMESPEKFVLQWRNEIEKTKAMGNMEKMREEAISENLYRIFMEGSERRYFAIIEYEFNNEVKRRTNYV